MLIKINPPTSQNERNSQLSTPPSFVMCKVQYQTAVETQNESTLKVVCQKD